jgi:hypothetical protein
MGGYTKSLKVSAEPDALTKEWAPKVTLSAGLSAGHAAVRGGVKLGAGETALGVTASDVRFKTEFMEFATKVTADQHAATSRQTTLARAPIVPGAVLLKGGMFLEYNIRSETIAYGPTGVLQLGPDSYSMKIEIQTNYRWTDRPWIKLPDASVRQMTTDLVNKWTQK